MDFIFRRGRTLAIQAMVAFALCAMTARAELPAQFTFTGTKSQHTWTVTHRRLLEIRKGSIPPTERKPLANEVRAP